MGMETMGEREIGANDLVGMRKGYICGNNTPVVELYNSCIPCCDSSHSNRAEYPNLSYSLPSSPLLYSFRFTMGMSTDLWHVTLWTQ